MKILTGFQPTGRLHLGNFLGAIRPIIDLQNTLPHETDIFVFIADLHTLSDPMKADELRKNTLEMTATLIACGIDTDRVTLFRQSRVPAHAELALLLSGMPRIGQLSRMTQFKDKSAGLGENSEGPRLALFTYPVLQAADILLYQTTHVPVGDDQRQHLQLTREIARKFNHDHARKNPVFTIPEPLISGQGARVMSLTDGTRKMSKSDPAENSRLTLGEDADTIRRKIRRATSDMDLLPNDVDQLEHRPEIRNLLGIHAALNRKEIEASVKAFAGMMISDLKRDLADQAVRVLEPIGERIKELSADHGMIEKRLQVGEEIAREVAESTLQRAYEALGFR